MVEETVARAAARRIREHAQRLGRLGAASSVAARAATDGWRLLCQLDASHPEAVREVLSYAYVQAWAMRLLSPRELSDTTWELWRHSLLAATSLLAAELPG